MASAPRLLLPPAAPPATAAAADAPARHRHATFAAAQGARRRTVVPRLRWRRASAAAAAAAAAEAAAATGGAALHTEERGGAVSVREFVTLGELRAAVRLRIRTFYEYAAHSVVGAEDLRKSLADREYEALHDRISGKMINFQRVSCINGTVPLLPSFASAEELCSTCKFVEDEEERVVVGSLDLNQCLWLPDELTGKRPGVNESSHTRAYLSNVCVAKELQRNGLGYALVDKSKKLAHEWGKSISFSLLNSFSLMHLHDAILIS
ncbi:hypothetical protein GUJ93_ZPchr0008g13060 [Zizania palustris]|uniref:N-acetyltransferase domain-containing protein n=1 Tax=Zizania palustris TaxID=103762 RepID=A0A8J5UWR7_ZIZPA|nr:hypothetical protein GUJ93_ZPchr0008g13060 [Zizania palustris]